MGAHPKFGVMQMTEPKKLIFNLHFSGRAIVAVILMLAGASPIHAQSADRLNLNHLSLVDGLSQSTAYSILQDRQGYMWFGTMNGLNRYNGYEFTVYHHDPDDPASISGNFITVIYEDSKERLWIGTANSGVSLYNGDSDTFIHYASISHGDSGKLSNNSVTEILEDSDGYIWIGTMYGLNRLDPENGEVIRFTAEDEFAPNPISNSFVLTLLEDSGDALWIGTANGLNRWDGESAGFTRVGSEDPDAPDFIDPFIVTIYEDSRSDIWIGTYNGGLYAYDREEQTFDNFRTDQDNPLSISGNSVFTILEDSRDNLWVGTEGQGLNRLIRETGNFYSYKSDPQDPGSLNHNIVYSLYESRDQILWIGTFTGGISYLDRKNQQFDHFKRDPADPGKESNFVLTFLENGDGEIFVGTGEGGMSHFDPLSGHFTSESIRPYPGYSTDSGMILATHRDREGRIWTSYLNEGLYKYDPETGSETPVIVPESQEGFPEQVNFIHESGNGRLWAGSTAGGIRRIDPDTGDIIQFADSLFVNSVYEDAWNMLWVGSMDRGLLILDADDGSLLDHFPEGRNGLEHSTIFSILEDQNENIWFSTMNGGIYMFNRENRIFTRYAAPHGLNSPTVFGLLEDDTGNKWMSTASGLSKLSLDTGTFTNYTMGDGLQSSEFIPSATYRDSRGYLYFGGINGFNRFHPDSVHTGNDYTQVVFTDVKVSGKSLPIDEESGLSKHISRAESLTLPHDASILAFEFVALDYHAVKNNQYSYMLEGFDDDWTQAGSQTTATYTNLKPGDYTFRVRAAGADGAWGEQHASIALAITPPFWQTVWFYLLTVMILGGLVTSGYRVRVRNITDQNRKLEIEVNRQTQELYSKNRELQKTLKDLNDARGELIDKAHKAGMAELATNVLHNVGNILNSVNVSATLIDEILAKSKLKKLKQANMLLRKHSDNLEDFILNNPKGKQLVQYYLELETHLDSEFNQLTQEKNRLRENINLVIDVVMTQQSYSRAGRLFEKIRLEELMENTLILQASTIERHGMKILTDYTHTDTVHVEKSKLVHTIVNLLMNAKESMQHLKPDQKTISIKTWQDRHHIYLSIKDSGEGIRKENLNKIFNHGFTTKKSGSGFGLHSCANYMQEMNGEITAESPGPGKGSTFTLIFPRNRG